MKPFTPFLAAILAAGLVACGSSDAPDTSSPSQETGQTSEPRSTVRVETVERRTVQTYVFGEGTARAVKREFLTFESAGRVDYIDPELKEGDAVTDGQLIAYQQQDRPQADLANAEANVIESKSQKAIAEARVEEAEASLELARNTYRRFQTLLEQTSASPQEVEEARVQLEQARAARVQAERQLAGADAQIAAAQAQYDSAAVGVQESRITAPIDGVLARLNIEEGQYFSPQQVQTTTEASALQTVPVVVVDTSTLEINVNLPSYNYSSVEVGRDVLILPEQSGLNVSASVPARAPESYPIRGRSTPRVRRSTRRHEPSRSRSARSRAPNGSMTANSSQPGSSARAQTRPRPFRSLRSATKTTLPLSLSWEMMAPMSSGAAWNSACAGGSSRK